MIYIILIMVILILFISYNNTYRYNNYDNNDHYKYNLCVEQYSNIITEPDNTTKIYDNECSYNCCKYTQYLPPELKHENTAYDKYIGSNMTCNNGCMCMKKSDYEYIANRGFN